MRTDRSYLPSPGFEREFLVAMAKHIPILRMREVGIDGSIAHGLSVGAQARALLLAAQNPSSHDLDLLVESLRDKRNRVLEELEFLLPEYGMYCTSGGLARLLREVLETACPDSLERRIARMECLHERALLFDQEEHARQVIESLHGLNATYLLNESAAMAEAASREFR